MLPQSWISPGCSSRQCCAPRGADVVSNTRRVWAECWRGPHRVRTQEATAPARWSQQRPRVKGRAWVKGQAPKSRTWSQDVGHMGHASHIASESTERRQSALLRLRKLRARILDSTPCCWGKRGGAVQGCVAALGLGCARPLLRVPHPHHVFL